MKSNLISVIIPVYNVEKYLKKCIDSVINQTYRNIEIILVDDGSPDNCGAICDEYAANDSRVKVIHKENEGVARAREIGIEKALGKFISFVDSDDYLKVDFFEKMINIICKYDVDWVACNRKKVDENGKDISNHKRIEKDKCVTNKQELFDDFYVFGESYPRHIWGKIFKTNILKGYKFQNLKICEDTCMMIDMFCKTKSAYLSTYDGYYYFDRADSVTADTRFRIEDLDWIKGLEYIKGIVKKICPEYLDKINNEQDYVLFKMYADLIEKGSKREKRQYEKMLRSMIKERLKGKSSIKKQFYRILYAKKIYVIMMKYKQKKLNRM